MKYSKAQGVLLLGCCLCLLGALVATYHLSGAVAVSSDPPTQQELTQQLAEAEQTLQTQREELAALLRAYYMGHAGERETKRLIEQVETERLYVEELQGRLKLMQGGS